MHPTSRNLAKCVPVLIAILAFAACSKSPEEKIASLRSYYRAELNGFIVQEEPVGMEMAFPEGDAQEAEVQGGEAGEDVAAEDAGDVEAAPVEVKQKILLDILLRHRSPEKLSGVTVDITMADPSGVEKGSWRVWFDTTGLEKATVTQFTHILEDIAYQEGDGFFAEVRHPVPPEERGEYREFAATD